MARTGASRRRAVASAALAAALAAAAAPSADAQLSAFLDAVGDQFHADSCEHVVGSVDDECGLQEAKCNQLHSRFAVDVIDAMWDVRNRVHNMESAGDLTEVTTPWNYPTQPTFAYTCKHTGTSVWTAIQAFQASVPTQGVMVAARDAIQALFPRCEGPGHRGDAMQHAAFSAFLAREVTKRNAYSKHQGAMWAKGFTNAREKCAVDNDGNLVSGSAAFSNLNYHKKLHYRMDINNNKVGADTAFDMTTTSCFLGYCYENSPSRNVLFNAIKSKINNNAVLINDPYNVPAYDKNVIFLLDPNAALSPPPPSSSGSPTGSGSPVGSDSPAGSDSPTGGSAPVGSTVAYWYSWVAGVGCVNQAHSLSTGAVVSVDGASEAAADESAGAGANRRLAAASTSADVPAQYIYNNPCYTDSGIALPSLTATGAAWEDGVDYESATADAEPDYENTGRMFDARWDSQNVVEAKEACDVAGMEIEPEGHRSRSLLEEAVATSATSSAVQCWDGMNIVYRETCSGANIVNTDSEDDVANQGDLAATAARDDTGSIVAMAGEVCKAAMQPDAWCTTAVRSAGQDALVICQAPLGGATQYAADKCSRKHREVGRMSTASIYAQCGVDERAISSKKKGNLAGSLGEGGAAALIAVFASATVVLAAALVLRKRRGGNASFSEESQATNPSYREAV